VFKILKSVVLIPLIWVVWVFPVVVAVQETEERIRGVVTFAEDGTPVGGAAVIVLGTNDVVTTDGDGRYEIDHLAPGTFEIIVQREHLTTERRAVIVEAGETVTADFALSLAGVHEEVSVTSTNSGSLTPVFDNFNHISVFDTTDIAERAANTIGEILELEPGIAMREFGPGSARPIIRGFDGDRVLVMEDGIRAGDLSSTSGDHGVTIDPNGASRIEIVRGPAALLYGSNAIGGVVNVISREEIRGQELTEGVTGHFGFDAGSANSQLGSSGSINVATGNLLFWGSGSKRRTDDYNTPLGSVDNSQSTLMNGDAGFGYFGDKFFASAGIGIDDGEFGVPFAGDFHGHHGHDDHDDHDEDDHDDHDEDDHDDHAGENELLIDLLTQRTVGKVDFGVHQLENKFIHGLKVSARMINYTHDESEFDGTNRFVATHFKNKSFVVRAEIEQHDTGFLNGRFGVWAMTRKTGAWGEEALAPEVEQAAFAAFGYEELTFGRHSFQFGARAERNKYDVIGGRTIGIHDDHDDHDDDDHDDHDDDDHDDHDDDDHDDDDHDDDDHDEDDHDDDDHDEEGHYEIPDLRNRTFVGLTGSLGYKFELAPSTSLVASLTRSTRAPAFEELYNFGPHVGSLTFEVGNSTFNTEVSTGLDVGLRHRSDRVSSSFNVFSYHIDDFIFLAGDGRVEDGLPVGVFTQGNSRFVGFDGDASIRFGGNITAGFGIGMVNAKLTDTNQNLPRIPPLRGTLRLTVPYGGFRITPELVVMAKQDRVFQDESVTNGHSVFNLRASWVVPTATRSHVLSASVYNMTNTLYRNHTSFIKDLAPSMGRGVKVGYTIRFF
tara:strand:- start:10422 stop:12920 length:2499 start_codon:yes stop_codon:yes gene_type:complete